MAKQQKKKVKKSPERKVIIWFWRVFGFGIASVLMLFVLASWGVFWESAG